MEDKGSGSGAAGGRGGEAPVASAAPKHLTASRSQMAFSSSSCPLASGPSGSNSKPRTAHVSSVEFGGVAMARSMAALKLEPKPEPWPAEAEVGSSSVVPRSMPGAGAAAPGAVRAKKYEMVADAATDAVVSRVPDGTGNSFLVCDPQALAAGILPRFFKHTNFASFIT